MKDVKGNILPIAVETAGMVLVEGISKMNVFNNNTVKNLIEFVLKNCVMLIANSAFRSNEKEGKNEYNFYFISASLNF